MENNHLDETKTPPPWEFVLYVAGNNSATQQEEQILHRLCEQYVPGQYLVTVIDVLSKAVELPRDLLAIPTVVRLSPLPERRVVGNLSEITKAALGLGFPAMVAT